mmetsp:Transcript_40120/g.92779  ORF Transcript_40120/g.92779 Transcript_40120/m.92779 type:complete len:409 (-) Transcript_40120:321-1547(-)
MARRTHAAEVLGHVVGEEERCLCGHSARHVLVEGQADVSDLVVLVDFSRPGGGHVPSRLSSQVHNDASWLHPVNVLLGQELRGRPSRDQGCSDDNVTVRTLLPEELHLCLDELLGHLFGVSACTGAVFFNLDLQELTSCRNDLLARGRSDVEGTDDASHVLCLLDGSQSGHASADDQNLCRVHLSRSGKLPSTEAAEMMAGLHHGAISRDVRHRAEDIVGLGSAQGPWHLVHSEAGDPLLLDLLHQVLVLSGVDHAEERRSLSHVPDLVIARRTDLEDDVGLLHHGSGIWKDLCARILEICVRDLGVEACTGLHDHVVAFLLEHLYGCRCGGNPLLKVARATLCGGLLEHPNGQLRTRRRPVLDTFRREVPQHASLRKIQVSPCVKATSGSSLGLATKPVHGEATPQR